MALFEVVLQSTYQNQQIINRFNYVSAGTPAAVSQSFALTSALGAIWDSIAIPPGYPSGTLLAAISSAISSQVSFDFISVKNIYSVTDFYETPFLQPYNGGQTGDSLSPTVAYGFRSGRIRSDIGRGYKRFVGVTESNNNNGGNIHSNALNGVLATLATRLGEVLSYNDEGNALTFTPCIVGKQRYVPNPARPDRYAYRYYPTEEEQLERIATGIHWDPYPQTRTQTSRQYGRGR